MTDYDAVVIGAGHNGLICATYLARAKHKVLVVDARPVPGGCASTREFAEGYRVSDCAQWLSQFDSSVMADMKLREMGLSLSSPKATISLQPDADHLIIDGDNVSGAGVNSDDVVAYQIMSFAHFDLQINWKFLDPAMVYVISYLIKFSCHILQFVELGLIYIFNFVL